MLALAYVRRSKNSKKRPSVSPERQAANIEEYARAHSWQIEWYKDTEGHRSGLTEYKRPAWLQLKARLESAHKGQIAAVVVNSLDRSSRKAKDFLVFLDLLRERGADFVSVTQTYLDTTTPYGRAMIASMMIFAQLEAEIDSQRLIEDIEYRQSEGQMWGPSPIGYGAAVSVDGSKLRIRPPDDDAPLVVRMLETYAEGDRSMAKLARAANLWPAAHVPGGFWRMRRRDGARVPFTKRSIESILDNVWLYAGQVIRYGGKADEERFAGKHEALIASDLAERVSRMRDQRENPVLTAGRQRGAYVYLLSPLLYCAQCGKRMRGQMLNGRPRYWHDVGSHGWARIDAAMIEAQLLERFRGWHIPDAIVERMRAAPPPTADPSESQQLDRLRMMLDREKDLYRLGDSTRDEYLTRKREIEQQIAQHRPRGPGRDAQITRAVATIHDLQAAIADRSTQEDRPMQKALVAAMIERIETDGQKITSLTLRPFFESWFKEVIEGYPQPDSRGQLDHLFEVSASDPIPIRERCAGRNAEIHARRLSGWTYRAIAEQYGVSVARVQQIVKRHR